MRAFTLASLALASLIGALSLAPAMAQVERLPEQSRAERQAESLNRAMVRQQMQTRQNQQTQFEINQLRNELNQMRQFPSMTGPGVGACPPGSIC